MQIYASFGLDDILDMVVRPNKKRVSKDVYECKARRWKSVWPQLRVVEWEDSKDSLFIA